MRKLFAYIAAMSLAGPAMAGSVAFDFGTNFYRPSAAGFTTENGQNFAVSWNLDNDISFGIYSEQSEYSGVDASQEGTLIVSAVQITKGVVKNVSVGLRLGSAESESDTDTLTDIFGVVDIISGSGEQVSGALRATASARFSSVNLDSTAGEFVGADGVNLILSVQIEF